ncbi:MAG: YIP1 family protein [Chloroflexi bacterium]|nr:YIP1 family protein [Chloroflexota bacterium]MBV9602480.1 YIP1 family protein [Chloroflexota bacterium]
MGQLVAQPSLTDRMIRAARLDVALYNEVEADTTATNQALAVVVITAVCAGIGALIGGLMVGRPGVAVGGLIGAVVLELIGWAVWSYVMFFVGTKMFHGTATYGELLRTLGFAYSPGVLLILQFIPVLGGIIAFVVAIWRIITGFIGVREALDLDTGNTIAVIVVGIIAYLIVLAIVGIVLGALGLGVAAMTGAFR